MAKTKTKYYKLKNILSKNAVYNIIFGERSNGKTYSVLEYGIEQYYNNGKQLAIVRRWQDDFTGKRGLTMFDGIVSSGAVSRITGGTWSGVYYYGSRWYLCRYDDKNTRICDESPFAYGFSLTAMEHDKSTSYPNITTIMFDEFLTRSSYLPDEFVLLMNVISTIVRDRTDVKIFMLGNTVNKYCPYFTEMGLRHIKQMQPGSIDVYSYGKSGLSVAVEYVKPNKEGKESDFYFAFDNPKLQMITGGAWEIDIYPHSPTKIRPKDILYSYLILFDGERLQADIVLQDDLYFTFIHRKTTEISEDFKGLIYTDEYNAKPNYRRKITKPTSEIEQRIIHHYKADKVFYADNEVGEIVRNYLKWCGS